MKVFQYYIIWGFFMMFWVGCASKTPHQKIGYEVISPSNNITIGFSLKLDGTPIYWVKHQNKLVIDTSKLGFELKGEKALLNGFKVVAQDTTSFSETWKMPWGEQQEVLNNYRQMVVKLEEKKGARRKLNIHFRAYDDGIGFRYEFLKLENQGAKNQEVIITKENTQFKLTGDHTCWWIPGDWDSYEHLYNTTKFSEIDALSRQKAASLMQTTIMDNAVNTPVTMRTAEGLHLSFHEANLTDYAGMTLKIDPKGLSMESALVGSKRTGYLVKRTLPFKTPWRTIQIGEKAGDLIESKLILNLNEPNKLGDVSWFKPKKYVGIWWEMHLDKASWDKKSGKHGATTKNAKAFIDFAAKNNITGLLVEGWNTGWENWLGRDREGVFDFVTPYPDYDLQEVVRYGKEKGVEVIMHHETSAAPRTYEKQLKPAYTLMKDLGIKAVKTGYVGKILPEGEYHHGQWMVNHYRKVLTTAAQYNIAINAHEPIKATGIRRTYPNAIAREGVRGQEFNAWSVDGGNKPDHTTIIPFTRGLGGPIDFTPGVFNIKLEPYKDKNQVNTTLAKQLALYVVIYSPVQMACDLIEHYGEHPALQFIRDVGVDWEQSKVLDAAIGDYVTIVRKEKGTDKWFLGSITDENARSLKAALSFLEKGKQYVAAIYQDGKDAHWDKKPTSYEIKKFIVDNQTSIDLKLAAGGGTAISLIPATDEEIKNIKSYPKAK